jgi:uncharacterized spore protein YtfJ
MSESNQFPQTYEGRDPGDMQPSPQAGAVHDFAGEAANSIAESGRQMSSLVGRFTDMANASAAVGPAQSVGGHTVVPLATVSAQAGFGLGFGGGGGTDDQSNQGGGSGGGGGGGGRGASRVIAVADISESGVQVRPVVDMTALAFGAMALVGLAMLRGRGGSRGLVRVLRRG